MRFFKKIKEVINRWIEKLAEENKKSFKGKHLDCCNLNRNKKK